MPLGQVMANSRPRLLVHVEGEHALAAGRDAEVLELAGLQVVGEQVAAGVGLVARRRDAHGFLALDDAIDAEVRAEVELAVGLDEVDVALALRAWPCCPSRRKPRSGRPAP